MGASIFSDEQVKQALLAVVGNPTYESASETLDQEGLQVSAVTLRRWAKDTHVVQFEKLREEWAPKIEAQLANNLLDNARLAAETERLAIERAHDELTRGVAREPAKIARDLSQVKSQSVDKRLALQGRPTQITERRDVNEIVRALVGMKVVQVAEPLPAIEATSSSD